MPAYGRTNEMIKRFHVLYVGQIELDNIGRNGTPANDRRYSDEQLREAFFTARDIARLMDELGYDVLWTAEHHFQREGYEVFPNLIQLGLWLATRKADASMAVRLYAGLVSASMLTLCVYMLPIGWIGMRTWTM